MPQAGLSSTHSNVPPRSDLAWVLVPAAVMSLGWGLRGYIGGGTYGAMIPGTLVALCLCQYLSFSVRASAVVVAFGAIGIGFGGAMTYGQTLGLLRSDESFWWGLTGTTLKGAIWGLLGGAILGLGFVARHIAWRHLVAALLCMLIGVFLGIHFINRPKLIYFSDPVNEPREESWAGFLFGALALLAYVGAFQSKLFSIPARFAAYGTIGGGIGFGGGSLLLAIQMRVGDAWKWMPYWKYMEFTFGALFGAALGLCALHLRDRLSPLGAIDDRQVPVESRPEQRRSVVCWFVSLIVGVLVVLGVFYGWRYAAFKMFPLLRDLPYADVVRTAMRVLIGFTGMGCVLMLLSRRWQTVAWQTAISVTIVAAAIDWQSDLLTRGHIEMSEFYRFAFVYGMAAMSILFVQFWQHQKAPRLMGLFLFAVCMLMGIGYMMGLARAEIWWPEAVYVAYDAKVALAGGRAALLVQEFRSEFVVHTIFTTLFAISLWAGLRERARDET